MFPSHDPDGRTELKRMLKSLNMVIVFEEVHNQVWRPSWKHGYDKEIEDLLEMCPKVKHPEFDYEVDAGSLVIELLHKKYMRIMEDNGLLDEDLIC